MSDWEEEDEAPDSVDAGDERSTDLAACAHCRAPLYEDAEMCPKCGHYVSEETDAPRKPLWFIAASVAVLAAIVFGWILKRH